MSNKLVLQLLVVAAFTGTQIEAGKDKPFQKITPLQKITPPAQVIGQFSVKLANQSNALLDISDSTGKKYPASQNLSLSINSVTTLKIKMSNSNRGHLEVSAPENGSIRVVEHDTNNRPISKYVLYYDYSSIPAPQIMIYDNPQLMSSSGFIVMMQADSLAIH